MKILISAVGNHDPYNEADKTEGPVLGACEKVMPNHVYLLPTAKQVDLKYTDTEDQAYRTKEALENKFPEIKIFIRPLDLPDPTDYFTILTTLKDEFIKITEKYRNSKVEYHISATSGTSQFQACILLLVNAGHIKAKIWQVIAPRFVESGLERVREVETRFLEEENRIARARKYFRRRDFSAAADELLELFDKTLDMSRQKNCERYMELCEAYNHWDIFRHEEAFDKLEKVLAELERFRQLSPLREILAKQKEVVKEIIALGNRCVEGEANLIDLYHNARRRYEVGQYVDCLNRFRRLFEATCYFIVRRDLKVKPNETLDRQPYWLREVLKKDKGYVELYEWVDVYEERMGREIINSATLEKVKELTKMRNDTYAAHGMKPVKEPDAKKALALIEKILKDLFSEQKINSFPFSKNALNLVEQSTFETL